MLATLRLPDVALYGELLHGQAAEGHACWLVAHTLIGALSGALRSPTERSRCTPSSSAIAPRPGCSTVEVGGDELSRAVADENGLPVASEQARLATLALTRATASPANEPTRCPGRSAPRSAICP